MQAVTATFEDSCFLLHERRLGIAQQKLIISILNYDSRLFLFWRIQFGLIFIKPAKTILRDAERTRASSGDGH